MVVIEIAAMTTTRRIAHRHDDGAGKTRVTAIDTDAATTIGARAIDHLSDFAARARPAHPSPDGGCAAVLVSRSVIANPSSNLFRHVEPPA
jgi:hypothetical protein